MNLLRYFFLLLVSSIVYSCTAVESDPWMSGFLKTKINPVLTADSSLTWYDPIADKNIQWQKADVFNPAAIVANDTVFLFYRAEDNPKAYLGGRTSRIGLATSTDGINFIKHPNPVLYPDSSQHMQYDYPGGCEDPRVVKLDDGRYLMTYTSWNQKIARLSSAVSNDLRTWQKQGPVFLSAFEGKFKDTWSKSGAIVTKEVDGEFVAVKINGTYWMYWGDTHVFLATSENLIDWKPLVDAKGDLQPVMSPRPGKFDSFLAEPGPPAMITENGILLFYNGMNEKNENKAPEIPQGAYCGGQALFDNDDPSILLNRMDTPFICPDLPHEVTGQYQAGTTFIEGLVHYKEKWFLYYGTADSMVGLAVKED